MIASKIKPETVYAIRLNDKLVRFEVSAVVTRREKATGSPHDYKSLIEGHVLAEDGGSPEPITIKPEGVLGEYREYTELAAKADAEKAERQRIEKDTQDARDDLVVQLHRVLDVPVPAEDSRRWDRPFHAGPSGVDIKDKHVKALTELLRGVK